MATVTIYHNPRCSKSRQTLALLEERQIEFEVVEYLRDPPTASTLREIAAGLDLPATALVREREWAAAGLPACEDQDQIISHIAQHPEVMQRPIVVCEGRARIGRPPESVLEIL